MENRVLHSGTFGQIFRKNSVFLIPFILFFLIAMIITIILGKRQLHVLINELHCTLADQIFYYLTFMGDGIVAFLLVFALMWHSYRDALLFLIVTLIITVLVALLKNLFFPGYDRPVTCFNNVYSLHLVDGYTPPRFMTFPSGHSATAFSVYFYLALLFSNRLVKVGLFIFALVVAYSRVYLSAHFIPDIAVGSAIGLLITWLGYYYRFKIKTSWANKKIHFIPLVLKKEKEKGNF